MRMVRLVAATALVGALVACAQEPTQPTVADTTVEYTATETNTVTETETPSPSESSDTATLTTATGSVIVPAGLSDAVDKDADPSWGDPLSVDERDDGWVVAYDDGNYVTWNENTGGAPIWGEIARTWLTALNPEQALGMPLSAESDLPDGTGWVQEFEHGKLTWSRNDSGQYSANVEMTG